MLHVKRMLVGLIALAGALALFLGGVWLLVFVLSTPWLFITICGGFFLWCAYNLGKNLIGPD